MPTTRHAGAICSGRYTWPKCSNAARSCPDASSFYMTKGCETPFRHRLPRSRHPAGPDRDGQDRTGGPRGDPRDRGKDRRHEQGERVDGMEQCSVVAHEQGTEPDKVVPAIKVVGNGFISLMAYQARGYAYIRQ